MTLLISHLIANMLSTAEMVARWDVVKVSGEKMIHCHMQDFQTFYLDPKPKRM